MSKKRRMRARNNLTSLASGQFEEVLYEQMLKISSFNFFKYVFVGSIIIMFVECNIFLTSPVERCVQTNLKNETIKKIDCIYFLKVNFIYKVKIYIFQKYLHISKSPRIYFLSYHSLKLVIKILHSTDTIIILLLKKTYLKKYLLLFHICSIQTSSKCPEA